MKSRSLGRSASRTPLLAVLVVLLMSSCARKDYSIIDTIFGIEDREPSPSSVEELKKAIDLYGERVRKAANDSEKIGVYWRLLATRYLEKSLYGEAYKAALKALEFFPDNSGLYYTAGVGAAYLAKAAEADAAGGAAKRDELLRAARASYESALKFNPRYSKALYGLAVLFVFELADPESALPHLKAYLGMNTKDVDGWFLLGRAYYALGRKEEAVDAYDKAGKFTVVKEKREQAEANKKTILDELYGGK